MTTAATSAAASTADALTRAIPLAAPAPVMNMALYTQVLIIKAGEIDGHPYRRGTTHHVDAATHAALLAGGMIATPTA